MALKTRVRTWFDPLVRVDEPGLAFLMTAGAQLANGGIGHERIVRAMGVVAPGAILGCGLVGSPISPIPGHILVTDEAQDRLGLQEVFLMGRAMGQVACPTIQTIYWLVLYGVLLQTVFHA
jgi:glycine/D-amino acid oxidase-like deaminating enzyme